MSNSKSVGSMYMNPQKDLADDVKSKVNHAIEYLRENGVYFSISINKGKLQELSENEHGYIRLSGIKSQFKKTSKDADFFIAPFDPNFKKDGASAGGTPVAKADNPFG